MAKQKKKSYVARCVTDEGAVTFKPKDKVLHSKGYIGTVKRTDDNGGAEIHWHGSKKEEYPAKIKQADIKKVTQILVYEVGSRGVEKAVGFISPKALWVKDGDKFSPEDVLKIAALKAGTIVYAKSDEGQNPYKWQLGDNAERDADDYEFYFKDEAYYKFKIKCGNCELFH